MKSLYLLILVLFVGCLESSSGVDDTDETAAAALLLKSGGTCNSQSLSAFNHATESGSTGRTLYNVSGCNSSSLDSLGFYSQNVETGLKGTSTSSVVATKSATGQMVGGKAPMIEVKYTLNNADGYIDIVTWAGGTSASDLTGPGFRIKSDNIYARGNTGTIGSAITGTAVASSVGTQKTICMEFHNHNGEFHFGGWDMSCDAANAAGKLSKASNTFDFQIEGVVGASEAGQRYGFVLNNVTLTSFAHGNVTVSASIRSR